MTPDDTLTMDQAAAATGLSYDRFRKVWPDLVRHVAFPHPLTGGARRRIVWDQSAVAAWRAARSRLGLPVTPAATANDTHPTTPPGVAPARLHRERRELARIMRGA